jgi:hypothetical protein
VPARLGARMLPAGGPIVTVGVAIVVAAAMMLGV